MALEFDVADVVDDVAGAGLTSDQGEGAVDAADVVNGSGDHDQSASAVVEEELPACETATPVDESAAEAKPAEPDTASNTPSDIPSEITPEQKAEAERLHAIKIAEATEEYKELSLNRLATEGELKEMKAEEKAALTRIKSLTSSGPIYPKPKSKIAEAVAGQSVNEVDDENADETWKQIETASILDGIKGMGKKKAEAITELAPTLGDIEELRGQASVAHKHFAEVLPTGVGKGMADEIENKAMEVIAKHCLPAKCDGEESEAAGDSDGEAEAEVEPASEVSEPAG